MNGKNLSVSSLNFRSQHNISKTHLDLYVNHMELEFHSITFTIEIIYIFIDICSIKKHRWTEHVLKFHSICINCNNGTQGTRYK